MKRTPDSSRRQGWPFVYRKVLVYAALAGVGLFSSIIPNSAKSWQDGISAAAPGGLDPTFGSGGVVMTNFSGPVSQDVANAIAIQPDGKIVVAGTASPVLMTADLGQNRSIAVARYNSDGSLDTTFSGDGKLITYLLWSEAHAVALEPVQIMPTGPTTSGRNYNKIWVAGYATTGAAGRNTVLICYNPDGSFNISSISDVAQSDDEANAIVYSDYPATAPSGLDYHKVWVAGYAQVGGHSDFVVSNYDDITATRTNLAITDFFGQDDVANAIAVADAPGAQVPSGLNYKKVWAAGYATTPSGRKNFAIAAYDAFLKIDGSFSGGKVTTDFGGDSIARAMALQPDGKIVLAGVAYAGTAPSGSAVPAALLPHDFALARYNPDGSLDSAFGSGGKLIIKFPGDSDARAVQIEPDGKIIAAGSVIDPATGQSRFAIACYNSNGKRDKTFAQQGRVMLDYFHGEMRGADAANAVAIAPDRRIIAAGTTQASSPGGFSDFALACMTPAQGFDINVNLSLIGHPGSKIPVTIYINRYGGFSGELTVVRPTPAEGIKVKPAEVSTTGDSVNFKVVVKPDAPLGGQSLVFTCLGPKGNQTTCTLLVVVQQ